MRRVVIMRGCLLRVWVSISISCVGCGKDDDGLKGHGEGTEGEREVMDKSYCDIFGNGVSRLDLNPRVLNDGCNGNGEGGGYLK